jgi:hypothetical protein
MGGWLLYLSFPSNEWNYTRVEEYLTIATDTNLEEKDLRTTERKVLMAKCREAHPVKRGKEETET